MDNRPNPKLPIRAPKEKLEPTQPAVSVSKGPSSRGLGIEFITGSAGENQPAFVPWLNANIFTISRLMNIYAREMKESGLFTN